MNYSDYMKSGVWRQKRQQRLAIDNYTCQCCGCRGTENNRLEVHHFGYKKPFGQENAFTDLVTLCHACHRGHHRMMNRVTNAEGRRGWKDDLPKDISVFYDEVIEVWSRERHAELE